MVQLIEKHTIKEYSDLCPNQIITRCRSCEAEMCYYNSMFKYNGSLCVEEFSLFKDKWRNDRMLCHNCSELIGCLINFERLKVVKFHKNKINFWHNS